MERILLATDFSQWTARALDVAFSLAKSVGAEVCMVHGIEPIAGGEDASDEEFFSELVERSRERLEALVQRAEAEGISARFHIEIGHRWKIILDLAEADDVDLIIMGRRAYKDHQEISLGTTSQKVYFGTRRSVMTVPSLSDEPPAQER